ncbi:hypothetical protein CHS0354_021447, partial [Potamilus streckersoni]
MTTKDDAYNEPNYKIKSSASKGYYRNFSSYARPSSNRLHYKRQADTMTPRRLHP